MCSGYLYRLDNTETRYSVITSNTAGFTKYSETNFKINRHYPWASKFISSKMQNSHCSHTVNKH